MHRSLIIIATVIFIGFAIPVAAANKSGVEPQVISLPKGPGSIEGLGESFEPQLNTGTSTYRVKIAVSPGVNKQQPEVSLEYNSGYGNSVAGIGWELSIPYIQRRTDKGLPDYTDNDRFTYSRSGEIVPLADGSYRLKVEGQFMKFQRSGDSWVAGEKNGAKLFFGTDMSARQMNSLGVFRWFLQKELDTNGNEIRYSYTQDNGQVYLDEIRYSIVSDTVYKSIKFVYEARPDAFSDYHSRSLILTTKRIKTIEVRSQNKLVRAYRFAYQQGTDLSLLSQVIQTGADNTSTLPPLAFTYSAYNPQTAKTVTMTNQPPVMISLTNPEVELVDINGDSLPDIVYTDPSYGTTHNFYLNRGSGAWDQTAIVPAQSPQYQLSADGVMMADMDGDGLTDLFIKNYSDFGYFKSRGQLNWEQSDWTACSPLPNFNFQDANIKLLDTNNDGLTDVMIDGGNSYYIWLNHKDNIWNSQYDYETQLPGGNHLQFALSDGSPNPRVKLADMNGDRMEDLVYISDGLVAYFPDKGLGQFASKVVMIDPPDGLGSYADYLELADINNDGFADIILVGNGSIKVWFNTGKDSFKAAALFSGTPDFIQGTSAYRFADMNADGFRDLLITSESSSPRYQYVDFTNGAHPNLLTKISNGLGQETTISYKSSTDDYIADRDNGTPWTTRLPFPVQVVKSVAVKDLNSGQEYVTDYSYRDGYYDGIEKEFRGFGGVTKLERGGATSPTLKTAYTFDTGKDEISRKGMVKSSAALTETGTVEPPAGLFDLQDNTLETRTLFTGTNGETVKFSFIKAQNARLYENTAGYTLLSREFDQDDYGNTIKDFNYGIVAGPDKGVGKDELLTTTTFNYDVTNWVLDRPDTVSKTGLAANFVSLQKNFYDAKWNLLRQEASPDGTNFIKVVRNEYDSFGNIIKITDANDHWRQITYDPTFHTFPTGETIGGLNLSMTAAYDIGAGVVTSFTDFNNNTTSFGYDTFARLTSIIKPGDSAALPTQQFSYTLANPVSSVTSRSRELSGAAGTYDTIAYSDGLGRKLQTRSEGTGGRWVVADAVTFNQRKGAARKWLPYFASTSAYSVPDPAQSFTALSYDAKGRSVRETNPDASFRATVYQPLTKVVSDEEDNTPSSPHANTPHSFISDGLERLVEVRERNGAATYTTRYEYDGLNNLTRITDNESNVKTMLFDGLGRKLQMYDPDKHKMTYGYDPAGNLLSTTDAKAQTVAYGYDEANRILTEGFNGVKVRYHYDADLPAAWPGLTNTKGKLAWVEDEAGRESYSYDQRGNSVMKIREAAGLTFINRMGYDAMDRLTSLTYPDGFTVNYAYNSMNLLDSVPGFVTAIDYQPTGQKERFVYANGIDSGYRYDPRQRLTSLTSTRGGTTLQNLSYGYDTTSNITTITDGRSTKTPEDLSRAFVYDDLYRLTEAKAQAAGWLESYQYSSIGNMTYKSDIGVMTYGGSGAGPHALTRAAGANIGYGYDANGNISTKTPGFGYSFDHRDRLAGANRTTDGAIISYGYDYKGDRITKSVSKGGASATTVYADKFTEVRGAQLIKQVYAGDRLVARITTPFDAGGLITRTRTLSADDFDIAPKDGTITQSEIRVQGLNPAKAEAADVADALRLFQENHETRPTLLPFATIAGAAHEAGLAGQASTSRYFYLPDHLGSASIVTDASGAVTEESVFYPYGKDRKRSGPYQSDYRFTGKELDDETGLHYFGARYYDSLTGRFVSVDPLYVDITADLFKDDQFKKDVRKESKEYLNLYAYVENNPINFSDQLGLYWFRQAGEDYLAGREGTIVEPGKGIGALIDDYVPAGHTFADKHDGFVGTMQNMRVPDLLINIPSMPLIYKQAVYEESIKTIFGLSNNIAKSFSLVKSSKNIDLRDMTQKSAQQSSSDAFNKMTH
jgi:RHS repeat-associated protein